MNNQDFHQPFIKSLLLIATITLLTMAGTHWISNYYSQFNINPTIYTSSFPASPEK